MTYAIELRRAGHDVTVVLLYPFSSRDNYARRLREAIDDSIANRNMIPFDVDELRRELGLEKA